MPILQSRPSPAAVRPRLLAAGFAALLGGLVLFGWEFDHDSLTRIVPGLSAMNPMTAVCLILAGLALLLRPRRDARLVRVFGALIVAVGAAKLIQLGLGRPVGVDELLFADRLGRTAGVAPSRIAPNTAFALVLLGGALVTGGARDLRLIVVSQVASLVILAITTFAVIGYLLDLVAPYEVQDFNAMALHAAVALLALAVAIISINPQTGLMRIINDRGPAGMLARTSLPFVLLVPVLIGWLRLSGESLGFYGTEEGVALQVFANVLVTAGLLAGGIVALFRSDSARRERELAVGRSERQYRLAERIAHVGHWRLEYPSETLSWSDEFTEICGLPRDAKPDLEAAFALYHPDDVGAARAIAADAVDHGSGWDSLRRIRRPDGEVRYIRSHGVCERDEDGALTALFGVFVDVTELELARREAEAATESKAAFLANMSHEIRTPMNGVLGFSELLLDSALSAGQRRNVTLIRESAQALLKLLNDILDISKIEAGQLEIGAEPFNVRHGLSQCVRLMVPMAEQKGLEIRSDLEDAFPSDVVVDGLRLRQIVLNLLGNAVKFTQRGSVSVSLREQSDGAGARTMVVEVADTGVGIAEERMAAIFDAFVQADISISRRFGGSGLGLSISRQLAELMGGSITLDSRPGEGTIVTLTLPLVEATRPAPADAPAAGAGGCTTPARRASILLVEDIDINQELVTTMLTRLGHSVELAENGAEALHRAGRLRTQPDVWDLILMDLQMPVMDGLSATRAIRALGGRAATIPIVALTASAFAAEIQECRDAGMNDHVAKPIAIADLTAAIDRWLGAAIPADAPPPPAESRPTSLAQRFQLRRRDSAERLIALLAELGAAERDDEVERLLGEAEAIAHVLAGTAALFGHAALGELASATEDRIRSARGDGRGARSLAREPIDALARALG